MAERLEAKQVTGTAVGAAAAPPRAGRVGRAAAEHRDALLTLGRALARALPAREGAALGAELDAIAARPFRIVLAGRAGGPKTRLANALAGLPGLLPAQPAARTAITSVLNFGHPGAEPGLAFTLFDAAGWDELVAGAGRGGTGATGAEDGRARLGRLVEEMRTRAFMRLGEQYHKLLGQSHRVPALTPEVRARYFGVAPQETRIAGTGLYSDMTRIAEFHLPAGGFACPVSLVDPPGIDPEFAVRSEITAAALDGADLCLLVLDAGTTLAAPERRLLEQVLARDAGRLVVFLDAGARDGREPDRAALRDAVLWLCGQAAPEARVPVVLGATGGAGDGDGLAALAAALEEALFWGPALARHGEAAARMEQAARTAAAALRREAGIIRGGLGAQGDGATAAERIERNNERLARVRDAASAALEARLSEVWPTLRQDSLRLLRELSLRALGQGEGAAAAQALLAPAGLTEAIGGALTARVRAQAADLAARIGAYRDSVAALLAAAGADPDAMAPAPAVAPDLGPAFAALARLGAGPAAGLRPGLAPAEAHRRLMAPYVPVLETVVDDATLALGQAARAALEAGVEEARRLIAEHADAVANADRLEEIEGRMDACTVIAARLAAFCRISAGREDEAPAPADAGGDTPEAATGGAAPDGPPAAGDG